MYVYFSAKTSSTGYEIDGLKAHTKYYIKIYLKNSKGDGQIVTSLPVKTKEAGKYCSFNILL